MSIIRTATDLVAIAAQGRRMTNAPSRFDGTLDELFERYIERNVVIETIPVHLFDVSRYTSTANASGWHFAHIFDVKDRNTDYPKWRRRDVIARFIRNVHPCNYFLVPKADWMRWGGDERVIGYFAALHAERYADVWNEFVALAQADVGRLTRTRGAIRYAISERAPQTVRPVQQTPARPMAVLSGEERSPLASYAATRLTFKASVIERLGDDDTFRVVIPHGVIEMTKRQFKEHFPNVTRSASYREKGLYNYPTLPRVAMQFLRTGTKAEKTSE